MFQGNKTAEHSWASAAGVAPVQGSCAVAVTADDEWPQGYAPTLTLVTDTDEVTERAAERNCRRYAYRFLKRAFDIGFSACALVVLSPVLLTTAVAIRLETPGPAIFTQTRVGKDGREFTFYKFRSMSADAEDRLDEVWHLNEKDGPVFKIANDPRITRVGRFIRKLSIDELPQFLNVIKGDMSIVGPRPALPREVAAYTARQRQRLLVKQGITCFWQTRRNRDSITFDEWIDLDRLYVRQCGVWTDLKLIIQTVGIVLTAQGN